MGLNSVSSSAFLTLETNINDVEFHYLSIEPDLKKSRIASVASEPTILQAPVKNSA